MNPFTNSNSVAVTVVVRTEKKIENGCYTNSYMSPFCKFAIRTVTAPYTFFVGDNANWRTSFLELSMNTTAMSGGQKLATSQKVKRR